MAWGGGLPGIRALGSRILEVPGFGFRADIGHRPSPRVIFGAWVYSILFNPEPETSNPNPQKSWSCFRPKNAKPLNPKP